MDFLPYLVSKPADVGTKQLADSLDRFHSSQESLTASGVATRSLVPSCSMIIVLGRGCFRFGQLTSRIQVGSHKRNNIQCLPRVTLLSVVHKSSPFLNITEGTICEIARSHAQNVPIEESIWPLSVSPHSLSLDLVWRRPSENSRCVHRSVGKQVTVYEVR